MKTLTQLKKDLTLDTGIELINFKERIVSKPNSPLIDIEIPEKLQGVRYISRVQKNGVSLKKMWNITDSTQSWLDFPKASSLEYINDTFTITDYATVNYSDKPVIWQVRTYKIINE
jgi:hypothetical protein